MIQSPPCQTENLPNTRSVLETPSSKASEQIIDLLISDIRTNGGTHAREELNEQHVQDLEKALQQGEELEPLDVHFDGTNNWLSDGFHRIEAYIRASYTKARVRIQHGSQRDAILHGIKANAKHKTLKWSRQDKQRAIERLLRDPEWHQWSDNAIAQICGVDHKTVTQRRIDWGIPKSKFRKGADGRIINTGPISESNKARKPSRLVGENDTSAGVKNGSEVNHPTAIVAESQEDRHLKAKPSHQGFSDQSDLSFVPDSETSAKQNGVQTSLQSQPSLTVTPPSNRRKRSQQEEKPFTVFPKKVKPGEWWQLGRNNLLYCGDPASDAFQKLLPQKVEMLLRVVPSSEQWTQPVPVGTVSGLALFSPYEGKRDLSLFRGLVEQAIDLCTLQGDAVVLAYLPDPLILLLMDQLDSLWYCAEPDPDRCDAAVFSWISAGNMANKMKQPPVPTFLAR